MPNIHAIRAFDDNYVWVISQDNQAIIIDAGDAEPVINYLKINHLNPVAMLITHHHHDHIGGVADVKQSYPAMQVIAHQAHGVQADTCVDEGDTFSALGLNFKVWRTAGHTDTHLSYLCDFDGRTHIFCGDTLFSGGCGRVFTGTIDELFASLMRFNALSERTLFYPAHEYTLGNLRFGLSVCADEFKEAIELAIKQTTERLADGRISLPTTLENERKINVFLQIEHAQMIDKIAKIYSLSDCSPVSVFAALRELKNHF